VSVPPPPYSHAWSPGAVPVGSTPQTAPWSPYPGPGPFPGPAAAPPSASRPGLPVPPQRTHRWGLGAYLLVEVVRLGASLLIGFLVLGSAPPTVAALLVALSVPTSLAAGTALLATRVRGNGPRVDLCLRWSWHDVGVGLAFGLGGLALTIPAAVLYSVLVGLDDVGSAIGDIFAGLRASPVEAVAVVLIVALLAPLCEEIVYRGLLWGAVERLRVPRWVPLVVTTLLFALVHFEFTRTPLLLVVALPIAFARLYTGRLLASIVAHQVNNLVPAVMLTLALLGAVPLA
jgi:uncharacterized protein